MTNSRETLVMVLDCSASNKAKTRVGECIAKSVCIGETDDGRDCLRPTRDAGGKLLANARRGLCGRCYHRYRMNLLAMPENQKAVYTSKLIRLGRILGDGGEKKYKRRSVFDRLAS